MDYIHYQLTIHDSVADEPFKRTVPFAAAKDLVSILDLIFVIVRDEKLDPALFYHDLPAIVIRDFYIQRWDPKKGMYSSYMFITLRPGNPFTAYGCNLKSHITK